MSNLREITSKTKAYQKDIVNHPLYGKIKTLDDLNNFMEHHVFAVWDFMSLLKILQQNLTNTQVPWTPVSDSNTSYLINEIVVGEESDIDENGKRMSHYEMYLNAMKQSGANLSAIDHFVALLKQGTSVSEALEKAKVPKAAKDFVNYTFSIVESNKPHVQAAVFTFGREDLIPDMFLNIIKDIDANFPNKVSKFKYYLERHIEVDGGHHGELALKMTENLCGDDAEKWREAEEAVVECLKARKALWDGVMLN